MNYRYGQDAMGGIVIDSATRVKGVDGQTINGLYAAGEATGGVHGANVTFGRIAGKQAAARAASK